MKNFSSMVPQIVFSSAIASLLTSSALAQGAQFGPVMGLTGGATPVVASHGSASSNQLATAVSGLGLYVTGTAGAAVSGSSVDWTQQSCDACAWAKSAAFDDQGRLWVAASGYGLWRGTPNAQYTALSLGDSNIANWVGRGSDGTIWVVTGNSVLQVASGDKVAVKGTNTARLAIQQLALPATAAGSVFAASASDVFQLTAENAWQSLKAPADPLSIAQVKGVLHVGTISGVYRLIGGTWTELGPKGSRVNAIAAAADGSLVIATEKQGVQRLSTGKWVAASEGTSFADRRALALAADAKGNVYVGTGSGLQLPTSVAVDAVAGGVSQRSLNAALNINLGAGALQHVVTSRNDAYALIEGQGVFSRVGKSTRWEPVNDGLDDEPVKLAGSDTAAYVVTASGSIYSFAAPNSSAGSWVKVANMAASVSEIGGANDGTLWVGTTNGPVLAFDPKTARWSVATKGLENAGRITRFASNSTGTLYAGSTRGGVFRWDSKNGSWTSLGGEGLPVVQTRSGQGRSPVNALLADNQTIYAGTEHGVFSVADGAGSDVSWSALTNGLAEPFVTTLAIDAKGNLIAGTMNGAYAIAPATKPAQWSPYADTSGAVIAAVTRVGTEIVIATRKQPGKPVRTFAGG